MRLNGAGVAIGARPDSTAIPRPESVPRHLVQQPRLADARLAHEHDARRCPTQCPMEQPPEEVELVVPPDDDGGTRQPKVRRHRSSLLALRVVIPRMRGPAAGCIIGADEQLRR